MSHVSPEVLAALRAGSRVSRREYAHVDGCLSCRRTLGCDLPARPRPRSRTPVLLAIVVAAAAISTIAPLRAAALGFVEIFEPQHIVIMPMTVEDFKQLRALPDFNAFGTASEVLASTHVDTADPQVAQAAAGFRLRLPPAEPGTVRPAFTVTGPAIEQFVFSDAKAQYHALQAGRQWQPMPPGMDGSALRVAFGSMVIAQYMDGNGGFVSVSTDGQRELGVGPHGVSVERPSAQLTIVGERPPRGFRQRVFGAPIVGSNSPAFRRGRLPHLDLLTIAQMPVPKVGSTGISVQTLEHYLLGRPEVSPRLAAAIESLRDPTTTLAIPIPTDRAYAQPVMVDRVSGTLIGDNTGLGALVFWERDGFLYAVGGTRSARDIVAVADSLQ